MSVGSAREVFTVFLRLGLTSFGGPVAHISFFRRELVERRQWVSDSQFAQLIAISQFLPGPASSQLGFALGLLRARWAGAMAASIAFTLPSALLLFGFAILLPQLSGPIGNAAIHGLKLVALAVVAHGVMTMAKQLCPDPQRAAIATAAAVLILLFGGVVVQLLAVILGGIVGVWLCREVSRAADSEITVAYGTRLGWSLLGIFLVLLLVLPQLAQGGMLLALFEVFYRAGALVFGGGHVLLPMLEEPVVGSGWVAADDFVAGYGAAQAVPGPMFTIAAFLGASVSGVDSSWVGAAVALVAIFLPGLLLITAALPLWQMLSRHPAAASTVAGVNAAVVGLLGAALYDPLWTSAVRDATDIAIALVGFTMISAARLSVLYVVLWCVLASVLAGFFLT